MLREPNTRFDFRHAVFDPLIEINYFSLAAIQVEAVCRYTGATRPSSFSGAGHE
jgi:hypothetical protein